MPKVASRPVVLLQEGLLGKPVEKVLAMSLLIEEMEAACQRLAAPLLRLCSGIQQGQEIPLASSSLAWRMRAPLALLHDWVLDNERMDIHQVEPATFGDFSNFVTLSHSLGICLDWPIPGRLMHLLGLAMTRARLERHVGLTPRIAIPHVPRATGLSINEIAALCGLKLTTVRNAVSRRELMYTRVDGVPLDDALDWMIQRGGFLYPHLNAQDWSRRINGRLAADWLMANGTIRRERYISRLRLSVWRLSNTRTIALNAEGVRNCVLLIPGVDADFLEGLGLERLEDRSDDPAASMHREVLMLDSDETLWQCQAPNLGSLSALLERVAALEANESQPRPSVDRATQPEAAALGLLSQAE